MRLRDVDVLMLESFDDTWRTIYEDRQAKIGPGLFPQPERVLANRGTRHWGHAQPFAVIYHVWKS